MSVPYCVPMPPVTKAMSTQSAGCAMWTSVKVDGGNYWAIKTQTTQFEIDKEVTATGLDSGQSIPCSISDRDDPTTTTTTTTAIATSSPSGVTTTSAATNGVKLPKNAVELIVSAIVACNSTTPTLTQIASHIQTSSAAYRQQDLGRLVRMVQHHLQQNNPNVFLPVVSPAGHRYPGMARWAINRQVVVVGEDGSVTRRRQRPHKHASSSGSLGSTSLPALPPSAGHKGGDSSAAAYYQSYPSSSAATYYRPATSTYGPTTYLPPFSQAAALSVGTTMDAYGSSTGALPPVGPALYDMPIHSSGIGPPPNVTYHPFSVG